MTMFLLPPAEHLCQECAWEHDPAQPHNPQSMYYSVWFQLQHARTPTWADAMAHCDETMRDSWQLELHRCGVDIHSTKLTPS